MYLKIQIFNIDMAKLALKGHKTRGKEVIAILEMLGGKMRDTYNGDAGGCVYIIDEEGVIDWRHNHNNYTVYSLEEFLEKFPYKVGDKVSSKYLKNYKIEKMEWVATNNKVIYKLQGMGWYNTNELRPYKEETKEETMEENNVKSANHVFDTEVITFDIAQRDKYELDLQGKFQVVSREGKYYVERIKPKYPKTYEECCEVLGIGSYFEPEIRNATAEECHIFTKLIRLKRCRDAYWKIYGEEKGLGGPWKPDWNDLNRKYFISLTCDGINLYSDFRNPKVLAFPTAEIRDAYKENFNDDIEACKEFL